jgi:hypothetical protein
MEIRGHNTKFLIMRNRYTVKRVLCPFISSNSSGVSSIIVRFHPGFLASDET